MGGDVSTIKEKLDIVEIVSGYVKLEKAGSGFKGKCPFHSEKTPSFFVSSVRQSFYCFGCGMKGDIYSFIQEIEGLDFRGALKFLADKAGVELTFQKSESKTEKDEILRVLMGATEFFENELANNPEALAYIKGRGLTDETIKSWRLGYAPGEWRALFSHLTSLGYGKEILLKAGLIKEPLDSAHSKEPYDVFRDRIIFPLSDSNGHIIAFSGRALSKETEPKYLNSPDTLVFTKSEVLYGLDKAKDAIRKKDYTVLVEGQMDLVLSHQSGIPNCVASSGTAFTSSHLERLRHLSSRIILAFDADTAGEKAAERASILGISMGFEVKVALLPDGLDPADVARKDPEAWKDVVRTSLPSIEFFFNKLESREKDKRKLGKLVEKNILPVIKLMSSAIEQSHFVSLIAKRTRIKEELIWEDLKKAKAPDTRSHLVQTTQGETSAEEGKTALTQKEQIEERLAELRLWQKELPESDKEIFVFKKEESELLDNLAGITLRDELSALLHELSKKEASKDTDSISALTKNIQDVHSKMRSLEEKRKVL